MPKYIIMDSSAGECEGSLFADIKLKDENGKIIYFTLIETDDKPTLYKTNMRITHLVTEPDYDPEQLEIVKATKVVYKGENNNTHSLIYTTFTLPIYTTLFSFTKSFFIY